MQETPASPLDHHALEELLGRAINDVGATSLATLTIVGDRLGLYRELAAAGPLTSGELVTIAPDSSFNAASTMKVPVMIEFFRQVERGGLSARQPVLLVNQFASIVDGSPFSVAPIDDSDSTMYLRVGERVPAQELVERMIVRSSNLATNAVIAPSRT